MCLTYSSNALFTIPECERARRSCFDSPHNVATDHRRGITRPKKTGLIYLSHPTLTALRHVSRSDIIVFDCKMSAGSSRGQGSVLRLKLSAPPCRRNVHLLYPRLFAKFAYSSGNISSRRASWASIFLQAILQARRRHPPKLLQPRSQQPLLHRHPSHRSHVSAARFRPFVQPRFLASRARIQRWSPTSPKEFD